MIKLNWTIRHCLIDVMTVQQCHKRNRPRSIYRSAVPNACLTLKMTAQIGHNFLIDGQPVSFITHIMATVKFRGHKMS